MISEALTEQFDMSILVSNDSDFSGVLESLKTFNQKTGLIIPILINSKNHLISKSLTKHVEREYVIKSIDETLVRKCRLPSNVGGLTPPDSKGWI